MTANFSASQSISDTSLISFVDTSLSPDNSVTERRIIIQLANGNYLTSQGEFASEQYETWDISTDNISLSILPRSESPTVTVQWMIGGNIAYTKVQAICFDLEDYVFAYGLLQNQTSLPIIIQDQSYYQNFMKYIVNLFNAENAILYGSDTFSSQCALDKNFNYQNNQNDFF